MARGCVLEPSASEEERLAIAKRLTEEFASCPILVEWRPGIQCFVMRKLVKGRVTSQLKSRKTGR